MPLFMLRPDPSSAFFLQEEHVLLVFRWVMSSSTLADFFRDASASAFDPPWDRGSVGLVGHWGDLDVVNASPGMTPQGLQGNFGCRWGAMPRSLGDYPQVTSAFAANVWHRFGIMPRALEGACVVFVDARTQPWSTASGSLLAADLHDNWSLDPPRGGFRPIGLPIRVEGASRLDLASETFIPEHRALIRILVGGSDDAALPRAGHAPFILGDADGSSDHSSAPDPPAFLMAQHTLLPGRQASAHNAWTSPTSSAGQHGPPCKVSGVSDLHGSSPAMPPVEPSRSSCDVAQSPADPFSLPGIRGQLC